MSAIRIELELVDGSFVSGMLRAGQSVDGFKKELARLDPHFRKLTQNGEDVIKSFRRMDGESKTLFQHIKDESFSRAHRFGHIRNKQDQVDFPQCATSAVDHVLAQLVLWFVNPRRIQE